MGRGALILFEGLDRAGKTTQTVRLLEKLKKDGKSVELLKFPDRTTPIGQLINTYLTDKSFRLSDEAAHLLFSSNRWELAELIKKKLQKGITIILDRYVYSGVAYTTAKGLDRKWSLSPDIGLPKPDLTIFLNLASSSERDGFGDERYEVSEFQKKVKQQFQLFFNEDGWITVEVDNKNIDQVHHEVWEHIEPVVNNELNSEIKLF